ncbi:MMPL family transporter [Nocardia testacea]|uniref:MMPL family transporter n=1 Tax=Nocardia testacea TaxID=248551 RepID=UPI0003070FDA|nr:MMPL family transporter [Nocardia testacea]
MSTLLYRIGRFGFRARRLVVLLWVLVVAVLGVGAATLASPSATSFSLPGTQSQEAFDLLAERFAEMPLDGGSAQIVFVAEHGSVTDPALRRQITAVVDRAAGAAEVAAVRNPLDSGLISADRRIAVAEVTYAVSFEAVRDSSRQELMDLVERSGSADLRVAVGGDVMELMPDVSKELVGLLIAAVVLVITLGSLAAAGMSLVTGLTGVAVGLLGILTATAFLDLGVTTPILALMLGLAVGIDYALFIVSRYTHELTRTPDPEEAIGRAVGTAGSAVLFAGLTVVIALLGLGVVGIGLLTEMGVAAAVTVVVAVLVALTLLPALLGFAGRRVLRRGRRSAESAPPAASGRRTLAQRWATLTTRRPVATLIVAFLGLGVLTVPALDLRLGVPDQGTYPEHSTQRQAYDAVAEGFGPGFNGPLLVVADLTGAPQPGDAARRVHAALAGTEGVAMAAPPEFNPAGDTAIIGVVPRSGPDSEETEQLVQRLRGGVAESVTGYGARIAVTGTAAVIIDFSDRMADALWIYLLVVVGLSFLLLMTVFRSLVVPLKATVGFLLSVAATFGVLVATFQWGHLEWLGIRDTDVVVSMLPIFIIGVVFGLAMDYEVFLVTRMREEYVHGAPAVSAVRAGFGHGARVVSAAAIIMVSVFAGFATGEASDIVQIGVALAAAVAVDAFVVRMTVVPAVLALVGDKAWWLPRWLDRILPNLDVEGEKLRAAAAPAPAVAPHPVVRPAKGSAG